MLTTTGPATPGLPKWMCAAWTAPESPLALIVYLIDLLFEATVKVAVPLAFESLLGFSCDPFSVALYLLDAASAVGTAIATIAARASSRTLRMGRPPGLRGLFPMTPSRLD